MNPQPDNRRSPVHPRYVAVIDFDYGGIKFRAGGRVPGVIASRLADQFGAMYVREVESDV